MNAANRWAVFAAENVVMAEAAHQLGLWNQVCSQAQEAATKSFKAFLTNRHRPIPQVRHLTELLTMCVEADASLTRFEDDCLTLDKYRMPLTYPDAIPTAQMDSLPVEQDAAEALRLIKQLREALQLQ